MAKVIIIPDVHGRSFWQQVLSLEADKIIFLGDYTDPYPNENIKPEDSLIELKKIIQFKRDNPTKVTLLWGNHDLHYLYPEFACSRFSTKLKDTYNKLFTEYSELFEIAYELKQNNRNYLFTHAGVTYNWLHQEGIKNVTNLADSLNKRNLVDFEVISYYRGGFALAGSPIWADLIEHTKIIPEYIQIFGHTMQKTPYLSEFINCIDCSQIFVLEDCTLQVLNK